MSCCQQSLWEMNAVVIVFFDGIQSALTGDYRSFAANSQAMRLPAGNPSARAVLDRIVDTAGRIVLGKERQIRMALACLLARGHLLIEDLPGVGKTTLAHVLA